MKKAWLMLGVAVAMGGGSFAMAAKVCDVTKYGAKGNGKTKDTIAIQKAIDDCSAGAGGGTVHVPEGTYVIAPISLKSNMTLHMVKGATLLGSPDMADYPKAMFARHTAVMPLVGAINAENIAILGDGVIDGNGKVWWDYVKGVADSGVLGSTHPRPMGLVFDHSKHIKVEGITVQNAGFWQIVPYYSDDVTLRNIRVLAPKSPNTDAIDPFSSSNVVIDHMFASVGDDNVAIKSGEINSPGPDAPSKNITVTDCTFENGHGVSIGSEVAGGVQNVRVERVSFKGTDNGIRIKSNRDRGNDISGISFKDITMDGVKTSILISEYYPKAMPDGPVDAAPVQRLTPHFHNIRIENVKSINSAWAGVIVGLPESHVVDIELKNVDIQAVKGFQIGYADVKTDGFKVTASDGGKAVTLGTDGLVTGK